VHSTGYKLVKDKRKVEKWFNTSSFHKEINFGRIKLLMTYHQRKRKQMAYHRQKNKIKRNFMFRLRCVQAAAMARLPLTMMTFEILTVVPYIHPPALYFKSFKTFSTCQFIWPNEWVQSIGKWKGSDFCTYRLCTDVTYR
jgi:hypothetical protein